MNNVSKNPVFAKIFECNGLTAMHLYAEEALATATPEDKARLERILEANANDTVHVICAKAMGRNLEAERIAAFQAKRAAEKKAAGFPERVLKTKVKATVATYLFDAAAVKLHTNGDYLSQERQAFWAQRNMRQECWLAAGDTINDYPESAMSFLVQCQKKAEAAENNKKLDGVELAALGSQVTNGPFPLRKQFWKFVGYKLDHIVPKDLRIIVDVQASMWTEFNALYDASTGDERARLNKLIKDLDDARWAKVMGEDEAAVAEGKEKLAEKLAT